LILELAQTYTSAYLLVGHFILGFALPFSISIRVDSVHVLISAIALLVSSICAGQASSLDRNQDIRNLIENKQLATAEKVIVSRLVDQPHDADLITYLAELRLDQGRTDEALHLIDDAEHIAGPTALRAQIAGLAETARGQLTPAEKQFRQAIQLDPKFVAAHYFLARLLYTRNRFDDAIQESKATIALSPDFVRAYENLGLCYEGKDDPKQAEYWYREAIDRNSEAAVKTEWPLLDLATLLIQNEKIEEARPFLQQALALNPENAQSHFQMGILLEKSGDLRNALAQLHTAVKLDPKLASAYYRAARLCKKLGRGQEAQRDFEKYTALTQPKN
jgi:tetratricopeptide (TPR) repeat protein